jgi:hypothetical protein
MDWDAMNDDDWKRAVAKMMDDGENTPIRVAN